MRKDFLALATEGFLKIASVHQFRCSDHIIRSAVAIRKAAETAAAGLTPQACVCRLMGPVRGGGGSPGISKLGR